MARTGPAAALALICLLVEASAAAPVPPFEIRVDGKVLRKASGRVVLSLSAFELGGLREVTLANRRTGETRAVGLSSVYWDMSYSETLPGDFYDALVPEQWLPSVVWRMPDEMDALRDRLAAIYDQQNRLRRELGNALLDGAAGDIRVSSRLTLNKIEKYHRIAAAVARQYLKKAREKDDLNTYLHPMTIQIGFNPFGPQLPSSRTTQLQQVREAIYWEVHRVLTQHFGIDESMVDLVFDGPTTIREFVPLGDDVGVRDVSEFLPSVTVAGESIDCAAYLQRQGFFREVLHLVRLGRFRDPFITDRTIVDAFANEGSVVGVSGDRVAVTFVPPFMRQGETVFVLTGGRADEAVPLVLVSPGEGGFTLSDRLPPASVAKIRPGMTVRRK